MLPAWSNELTRNILIAPLFYSENATNSLVRIFLQIFNWKKMNLAFFCFGKIKVNTCWDMTWKFWRLSERIFKGANFVAMAY